MKCRGPRLKSCCCCVDLRAGCFFLALFEIFSSILGFFVGEDGRLLLIGRAAYMLHFIGSIFLLMSSFLIEVLVVIYLMTNTVHLIFCTAFVIDYALSCGFCALETIPVFLTLTSISGWWRFHIGDAFNGNTIPKTMTEAKKGYRLFWILECLLFSVFMFILVCVLFRFGLNFTLICKFAFNAKDKEENEKSKVPQIVCPEKYFVFVAEEEANELQAIRIGGKGNYFPAWFSFSKGNPITSFPGNFQSRAKCCQTEKSRFVCPATLACNAMSRGENWENRRKNWS
ncbi:uncharacterized protein LOC108148618 isoform X2 [Drosophila elegans]|uniref:uncharacterized protein LOC108148618 isoform X2 n=2 Tax=Drosophila elegans TaxID=30023 RepID=UPI0007E67ABD|nr:uncharacterized protein LOC108148618 isoform X2 [Drosophila elegans]